MKEQLEKILKIFEERETLRRIYESDNPWKMYQSEKRYVKSEIHEFKKLAEEILETEEYLIDKYEFTQENAIQICIFCIMVRMEDCEIFHNYVDLIFALRNVDGKYRNIARNLALFLSEEEKCDFFSFYTERNLIKSFFVVNEM